MVSNLVTTSAVEQYSNLRLPARKQYVWCGRETLDSCMAMQIGLPHQSRVDRGCAKPNSGSSLSVLYSAFIKDSALVAMKLVSSFT